MNAFSQRFLNRIDKRWLSWSACAAVGIVAIVLAIVFKDQWLPTGLSNSANANTDEEDSHAGHAHAGHDEANSLELSPQAQKNIGLTTVVIKPQWFEKTLAMPAMVVERPGRSQVEVTAPVGGRVTRVYPIQGEAIDPGEPLFELRLTHEELVKAQGDYLQAAEELDVVKREIARLESVTVPGAIAGKTIREREYEQQKLEAALNSQRQSLVLHGLTPEQVKQILDKRELFQDSTVVAPVFPPNGHTETPDHPFHIQNLSVKPGQYVNAGDRLCVLGDHHELWIEGKAFEQDIPLLDNAVKVKGAVSATLMLGGRETEHVEGLQILYLSDVVETTSRAFHFYVRLPNTLVRDEQKKEDGHRFVDWKFKPGQRMQILVTVERWENRIVLPVDAVAQSGPDTFVFEQNGDHFDRVPVHVQYRDQHSVVIENEGKLLGSTVASSGAHQMQMALKNKSGGAPDPHAGHNH